MTKRNHLPGEPQTRQSLVASAALLTRKNLSRSEFQNKPWQAEAWAHFDAIGELRYAARYESNAISRARLVAAKISDDPHSLPETLPDSHPASQIMSEFMGGRGNQGEALERLATQLYVAGVSYLVGYEEGRGQKKRQVWQVLSAEEIRVEDDEVHLQITDAVHALDGLGGKVLPRDSVVIIRVWTPHPRRWWEPDSAVRGVLPILRELDGLTKHVSATIDSRLAGAGLLVLPNEMTFISNRDDLEDGEDPFVVELIEAMMDPLENRDTAASLVPLVVKVPGQYADAIQHIRFGTDFDSQTKELREESIRRLALGLDIPPEILLGVGDVNHWTAWQIEESSVKMHIEPKLAKIAAGVTKAYLHPALEALGADAEDIVCWFDTTPLKLRPNRGADAQNLHDDMLITDESRRKASGFAEADAPEANEKFRMLLESVLINSPQLGLNLLPVYADLIGADSEAIRRVVEEIEASQTGPSNGADPEEQEDDSTPDDGAEEPDAATSAKVTELVNHVGNLRVPN